MLAKVLCFIGCLSKLAANPSTCGGRRLKISDSHTLTGDQLIMIVVYVI